MRLNASSASFVRENSILPTFPPATPLARELMADDDVACDSIAHTLASKNIRRSLLYARMRTVVRFSFSVAGLQSVTHGLKEKHSFGCKDKPGKSPGEIKGHAEMGMGDF